MEKRVLLAVFLAFVVLYVYQALLPKPVPRPAGPRPGTEQAASPAPTGVAREGGTATEPSAPAEKAALQEPMPAALTADSGEREIVVESDVIRAVFSNRGAALKSWQLKHYLDESKRPLELVPAVGQVHVDRPFDLKTDDAAVNRRLSAALFRATGDAGGHLNVAGGTKTLVFEYRDEAGLVARKQFGFTPGSYVVQFGVSVADGARNLNPTVLLGPGPGDAPLAAGVSRYRQNAQGILFRGGKVERLSPKDLTSQPVQEGDLLYAGVDDQYFLSVALPGAPSRIEYQPVSIPLAAASGSAQWDLVAYGIRATKVQSPVRFFVGPKDFDVLAGVDQQLVRVINFGFFSWLAVPLLRALKWINAYAGNYGWSIIILTVLINVAMFPLRHKSVVSMRKLQQLQPEIKAIQERYGKLKTTDPARQKMNTEMMNLYRERGVNPASGCVPMLLTIPVLFAFYSLLSQAIEIRGAPWVLWITDLSSHDPLYITPVLMGASMVWQQRITPSSVDPAQQKVMMMMPVIFAVMFLWAPSGLVLYWLLSNMLAIGQQYVTNRMVGPPAVHVVRPPAERRLKGAAGKAGSGAARDS